MKKQNSNVQELCVVGLATSLICVIAPFSILLPAGVPITLQTFIITLAAIILGAKPASAATLIYILLGAFGLPVFSNFTGGWQSIAGPTGGFILSFPLMAFLIGLGVENRHKWKGSLPIGIILGTAVNLLCGLLMFCFVTKSSFPVGLTTCVLPFLPVSIIKAVLASIIGMQIRKRLNRYLTYVK